MFLHCFVVVVVVVVVVFVDVVVLNVDVFKDIAQLEGREVNPISKKVGEGGSQKYTVKNRSTLF